MRWAIAGVVVSAVMLAGCSAPSERTDSAPGPVMSEFKVGNETILVSPVHGSALGFGTVKEFLATVDVVAIAAVSTTTTVAAERQPDPSEEGVAEGEGRDLFGTITFTPVEVLKGAAPPKDLTIVYKSGKRGPDNGAKRLGYKLEGLADFQSEDTTLKASSAHAGRKYLVFAATNRAYPAVPQAHTMAHPYGIAEILPDGKLRFPEIASPVGSSKGQVTLTIAEIRAALQ